MGALVAVALAVLALAAPAAETSTAPRLRVVTHQPLVVRGEAFRPYERVVVTAFTLIGPKRAVVRATARGRFAVTFRLPDQPCGKAFAVRAVGGRGSRATLVVAARPCIPPPIR